MLKRVVALLVMLLLVLSGVFADDSLLRRSIESCTYNELVEMSRAYGLDSTLDEGTLRANLLAYFNLEPVDDAGPEQVSEEATEVTSILIDNASRMDAFEDIVIISGDVKVQFSAEETGERVLTADRVSIDLKAKLLQASGNVVLADETGKERTFTGQIITLDWSNLDVVVFDGVSTTTRSNSSGKDILFYVSGDEVSYDGDSSGVFFRDGTIATWQSDPYWSITAKKLSLSENDMFVDRAVFRLGRVPVFYFPVFFYPGTTLSFNPAIGMSSSKGAFLSTTYEIYGQYPRLGLIGTSSSSTSSSETTDYSSAFTAFLEMDDDTVTVRDGIYYRPLREGEELSDLESWARGSGSYLAVFADVYQNIGLSAGLETKNYLFGNNLVVGATGVAAYRPVADLDNMRRFRYSFDFDMDYSYDDLKMSVSMPILSDPAVRVDFLNRNTAFSLDSMFGTTQYFPSTYSSQTTYTWTADASYSKTIGNYTFSLNSLKADVDYKLKLAQDSSGEYYYKQDVVEASLPYLSFSSNGTFLNLAGQSKSTTKRLDYTNDLALGFSQEQSNLDLTGASENKSASGLVGYDGPDVQLESTTVSEAGSFKLGYTYNQSMDNIFEEDLERDNFYTKITGSLFMDANAPGQWFSLTETLKPQFNYIATDLSESTKTEIDEFYLSSVLKASIPKVGLTYNLTQRIYVHYNKSTSDTSTDRWGEWDSTDVTAHNITFSKTWSPFTFGFYFQMRPLTEILKPSLSFSKGGFTVYGDFSMEREEDEDEFEKGKANLNLAYTSSFFGLSLANEYDFTKVTTDDWEGYTLVQKASVTPFSGLTLSENATFEGQFQAQSMAVGGTYELDGSRLGLLTSGTMTFLGEDFEKDELNVSLKLAQDQITFWKSRVGFESALTFAFNYDFQNPFKTYMTAGLSLSFSIAEFLDLSFSVTSANKSFSRYYSADGTFSFSSMLEDLARSFDLFGSGRSNTGFNLSSFKLSMVHYMRDWNLYIDAQGSLTTKYSSTSKYEWVPTVTVYVKWNAIPELKTQGTWNASEKEWT